MPFLIENIIATVIWLIVGVVVLIAGFIAAAVHRRMSRERFFQKLDRARARVRSLLDPIYDGESTVEDTLPVLQTFRSQAERTALEDSLLKHTIDPAELNITREIVQRLGWIEEWIDIVRCRTGRSPEYIQRVLRELGDDYRPGGGWKRWRLVMRAHFLQRCRAADRLSRIPSVTGLIALLAATGDPHVEVRELCVRNLGTLADPATMPVLIEELIQVLEGKSPLSVRTLKTALVQFSLDDVDALRPALHHQLWRVRFFATDIIREIAERQGSREMLTKNDFSPEMYRLFTERLWRDEAGDVRARAAPVIRHFRDSVSNGILQALLQDDAWFVRLHACRAAADRFFLPLAPAVAQRLTDPHWMVREAAVRSLRQLGEFGTEHILSAFLDTPDRYAAEQIAEEIQRSGMLVQLLAAGSTEDDLRQARSVARRMVALGKTTMLEACLLGAVQPDLKIMLIRELSGAVTPSCLEVLQTCADGDPDPRVRTAAIQTIQLSGGHEAAGPSD